MIWTGARDQYKSDPNLEGWSRDRAAYASAVGKKFCERGKAHWGWLIPLPHIARKLCPSPRDRIPYPGMALRGGRQSVSGRWGGPNFP